MDLSNLNILYKESPSNESKLMDLVGTYTVTKSRYVEDGVEHKVDPLTQERYEEPTYKLQYYDVEKKFTCHTNENINTGSRQWYVNLLISSGEIKTVSDIKFEEIILNSEQKMRFNNPIIKYCDSRDLSLFSEFITTGSVDDSVYDELPSSHPYRIMESQNKINKLNDSIIQQYMELQQKNNEVSEYTSMMIELYEMNAKLKSENDKLYEALLGQYENNLNKKE